MRCAILEHISCDASERDFASGWVRHSPVVSPQVVVAYFCGRTTGIGMSPEKLDLLQGTLDLMVLQTLTVMGSLHGYGIARRIEQVSGNALLLNQGTIYASLVRL